MKLVEFLDDDDQSPFGRWFDGIDAVAAAKVTIALARLEQGNISSVKSVGEGVSELRINFGPGYRIYFGRHGQELVILLTGGSKSRQSEDIRRAQSYWRHYRQRKG